MAAWLVALVVVCSCAAARPVPLASSGVDATLDGVAVLSACPEGCGVPAREVVEEAMGTREVRATAGSAGSDEVSTSGLNPELKLGPGLAMELELLWNKTANGIPSGTKCNKRKWCDLDGLCTTVCSRGSVHVDPWLKATLDSQFQLAASVPFCDAQLPGTHNSGITLADGYGNRDHYWQKYLKFVPGFLRKHTLRTHDQWLSLTDQLNLGVRMVELDTHWTAGELRIAHCGGLHSKEFDDMIHALNTIANSLGHKIRWDVEEVGCNPSMSSIPVEMQRSFRDAVEEIQAWRTLPGNENEFLVLFFDDDPMVQTWGKVPVLMDHLREVFGNDTFFTPEDREAWIAAGGGGGGMAGDEGGKESRWPSINYMRSAGRGILLLSGEDYGGDMNATVHARDRVCRWKEGGTSKLEPYPVCSLYHNRTNAGFVTRIPACELEYGPLNCDLKRAPNGVMDEQGVSQAVACNVNFPAPDLLHPQRMVGFAWSWAEGQPGVGTFEAMARAQASAGGGGKGGGWAGTGTGVARKGGGEEAGPAEGVCREDRRGVSWSTPPTWCAVMNATDGRWWKSPCSVVMPVACRSSADPNMWALGPRSKGNKALCAVGWEMVLPTNAYQSRVLMEEVRVLGAPLAWLPAYGTARGPVLLVTAE